MTRCTAAPRGRARALARAALAQLAIVAVLEVSVSRCSEVAGVRLRGSETGWDGRVEILHEKAWGTVCDTGWDLADANVTCRQLGFSLAVGVTTASTYGDSGDDVVVWLEGVECDGDEGDIGECVSVGGWGVVSSDCEDHTHNAGVICADNPEVLNIRLVGGASGKEGRVEVLFGDEWGGVCDDGWGLAQAKVVCRQLGFDDVAENQPNSGEFGDGVEVIWLDDVVCEGEERRLADCRHAGWAEHNCAPSENVGVRCTSSHTNCSIRLSDSAHLDRPWAGSVEIFANDEWGRVCSDTWDLGDAHIACRQLGYYDALEVTSITSVPPSELYWLAGVECSGLERVVCDCSPNGVVSSNCDGMSDARVVCRAVAGDPYAVRLVGGANEWEGRVEVSVNGEWGTVCSLSVSDDDVDVICRQLGYKSVLVRYFNPPFGEGSGVQWFDRFSCSGSEDDIFSCPHSEALLGQTSTACDHGFDLSLICLVEEASPNDTAPIRLVGGASPYEGRLEVLFNGRWGVVCNDGWSLVAADVTCSQLGYGRALGFMDSSTPPSVTTGPVPFWLDDIMCNGTETALSHCSHSEWGNHDCSFDDAVSLVCSEPVNDPHDVRLVGGPVENSGRVEIFFGGVWGSVCNIGWDIDDADVVCRQLGYPGALMLLGDGTFGEEVEVGVVWLEGVDCYGNESRLTECRLSEWGVSQCSHAQDVALICQERVEPSSHITSSPLTSSLFTSPLMLLPLSPSPDQQSSLEPKATPTLTVTMATSTTQKVVPTNNLPTSATDNSIRAPLVAIGVSTLVVVLSVTIATIVVIIIIRLCRRGKVVVYDTVGYKNGMWTRPQAGSLSVSFSSLPQHTVSPDEEEAERVLGESLQDGGRVPPALSRNFTSSHTEFNAHYTNLHTDAESPDTLTPSGSPRYVATHTQSSHAATVLELQSLDDSVSDITPTTDRPQVAEKATFV